MPKIIENLEDRLISEAKKQIEQSGYGAVTIRSIAKSCGVGVGTIYNYFPSKDALLASYMLSDWKDCVLAINAVSTYSDTPVPVLRCMYDQLVNYAAQHQGIFKDKAAASAFSATFTRYHLMLRDQLAAPLQKFCHDAFHAEFIAEALLSWSMAGKDFDSVYTIIHKLF